MNTFNILRVDNIVEYNKEKSNYLLQAPIKTLFCEYDIKPNYITLADMYKDNSKGTVFITSSLCRQQLQKDFEKCFDDLLNYKILQKIQDNRLKLLIFDSSSLRESEGRTEYTLRLINYLRKRKVTPSHCTIISNINNVKADYKLLPWEFFEYAVHLMYKTQKVDIDLDTKLVNYDSNNHFRFLCLNGKPRFHRYLLMYSLYKKCSKFEKHFNYSLRKISINDLGKNLIRYQQNIFSKFVSAKELIKLWPLLKTLPSYIQEEGPPHKDRLGWNIKSLENTLYKTGIDIVTETTLNNNNRIFLTEKTYRSIAGKMPFIICGQQGCLQKLRSLGYQTFNEFWDESYDNIECPEARINKITQTVQHLSSFSNNEYNKLIQNTKEIVEHNYNHFITIRIPQETKKIINLFYI